MAISGVDIADFWFLVRKSASLMDRGGEAIFQDGIQVSLAQFMVLSVVDAHPGSFNQQAVADLLGLTKGTVSRQIDSASRAGLLTAEVSASSRREKVVKLTEAGTDVVRRGDALLAASNRRLFGNLDEADLAAALRVLAQLTEILDSDTRLPSNHGVESGPAHLL